MKKINYNISQILIIFLFFVIIVVVSLSFSLLAASAQSEEIAMEPKQYSTVTIEDDFSEDAILIALDKSISRVNKKQDKFFEQFDFAAVEDLTYMQSDFKDLKYLNNDSFHQIFKATLKEKSKVNVLEVVDYIEKTDGVLWVGPITYDKPAGLPVATSGERYSTLWGLFDTFGTRAQSAWDVSMGSRNVKVGVIDTGIYNHPDLQGNLIEGWDFVNDNAITTDDLTGHGTHVAGIIGATGNTTNGVIGVSPEVTLVPLQVYDRIKDEWPIDAVANAIKWAIDQNIDIINYSGGGYNDNLAIKIAISNYKGLFVCSAGNKNNNNDSKLHYPSDYSRNQEFSDRVISVGNIDEYGNKYSESNYGNKSVSIYAPGTHILSTYPEYVYNNDGFYEFFTGTSMAAPYVAGTAALMLAYDSTLTAASLKSKILDSANLIAIDTPLGEQQVKLLNADRALKFLATTRYTVNFDKTNGTGGTNSAEVQYDWSTPNVSAPKRKGYTFDGYYTNMNGAGIKCYDADMQPQRGLYDINSDVTLFAHWIGNKYELFFNPYGGSGGTSSIEVTYGELLPYIDLPTRPGYDFAGYIDNPTNTVYYTFYDKKVVSEAEYYNVYANYCDFAEDFTMYAKWLPKEWNVTVYTVGENLHAEYDNIELSTNKSYTFYIPNIKDYTFDHWEMEYNLGVFRTGTDTKLELKNACVGNYDYCALNVYYNYTPSEECIAAGTYITLADGSMKLVEELTGNEMLLVWNLYTGSFDVAPILFIDSDPISLYNVIKLSFSDGTTVDVISEHGFWDFNLNRYVYLDENASQYIGHWFNKLTEDEDGNMSWTRVQLTNVTITQEQTMAYSPVTYGHLCYYVNGMLSMPGGIDGLFNIFEVDADTMMYDAEAMAADIAEYGLFTYEEFNSLVPVSEEMFEAVNGQYLKIAIGKGAITLEQIGNLVERYSEFF